MRTNPADSRKRNAFSQQPDSTSPEPVARRHSLQIAAPSADKRLTLDQERFNFLIRQIEQVRLSRGDLEARILRFRQAQSQKLQPLRAALSAICRESVMEMDRLMDQRGWSRLDLSAIRGLLCDTAQALLEANPADQELKAVFAKHSRVDFDAAKQEDLENLKAHAEEFTGIDLGDDESIRTEEDLIQKLYEQMAAKEAAAEEKKSARRKSAAEQRSEDNAQLARQSLREVYRRLASALHPDREPDPARREEKNALMQKINQAYAANDLLTLFETQMQIEQIDAQQISRASAQRIKQYNKLLSEQLARLKAAMKDTEKGFRMDFGLPVTGEINARKLDLLIQKQARHMRAEIAQQQQFMQVLKDKAAMKRWLKQQRRFASGHYDLDDDDL